MQSELLCRSARSVVQHPTDTRTVESSHRKGISIFIVVCDSLKIRSIFPLALSTGRTKPPSGGFARIHPLVLAPAFYEYTYLMRDILIVLSICLAAIILGAWLFFNGPMIFTETPEQQVEVEPVVDMKPIVTESVDIQFRVLDSGSRAAEVTERKNFAVYDATEFARLWKMANGTDGKAVPAVDFSKEYVIGVFEGEQPTGGYGIRVTSLTDADDTRTVAIERAAPAPGCLTTQALTSPYQLILVPVSSASLTPVETAVETPCS